VDQPILMGLGINKVGHIDTAIVDKIRVWIPWTPNKFGRVPFSQPLKLKIYTFQSFCN
jgi:hypothetical protein